MRHVAVDIETTGSDLKDDIVELAVVEYNIEDYTPTDVYFRSLIRPNNLSILDEYDYLPVNNIPTKELKYSPTSAQVRAMLLEWKEELFFEDKLMPMGHNYDGFDKGFLKVWLKEFYDGIFDYHSKDSFKLSEIAKELGVINPSTCSLDKIKEYLEINLLPHRAYSDCLATLTVYRKVMQILKSKIHLSS